MAREPQGEEAREEARPPRRESVVDRRSGLDRRTTQEDRDRVLGGGEVGVDRRAARTTDIDRRRGPGRRLSDFTKSAEQGEMTKEQFLFLMAIEAFKKANDKSFPSWTDVLEVIRLLGYRKTMPSELDMPTAEDWREGPDTPAGVRDVTPPTNYD